MATEDRTEEQVLVMRAQRGDQQAFRVLVERYQKLVYTLALRLVSNPHDGEDVAQEAFLSAWKGLPRFRMDAKFSTWLYRLTVNAATDLLRRRQKEQAHQSLEEEERPVQVPDQAPGPEEQAQAAERRAILQRAIDSLTENHRKILLLREVNGLDYQEIGQVLELTPGTVKSRLARARRELRDKLLSSGNYFAPPASKAQEGGEGHGQL